MVAKNKQRFCMRPMEMDDLDTVSHWFEHLADLSMFDRSCPVPVNTTTVKDNWQEVLQGKTQRRGHWFAIDTMDTQNPVASGGDVVGIVGIENINHVNGDGIIALYLAEVARGKGLGLHAGGILLDIAFDQLRFNRISSYYRDDNIATRKLTDALGFTREGVMREAWFSGGKFHDMIAVGQLKSEWPTGRKNVIERLNDKVELQFGRPPWQAKIWPESLIG